MQVGHLADHSGSPQYAHTKNKLAQSVSTQELVVGLSGTWHYNNSAQHLFQTAYSH